MEERIQSCYAETTLPFMHSDDFVKMILADAIFILELFYRYSNKYWERDDLMFLTQLTFMKTDLVLLENQLPFFVLEELFNLPSPNCSNSPSLINLTFQFFDNFRNVKTSPQNVITCPQNVRIAHFTDLIRTIQLPQPLPENQTEAGVTLMYSATQLHEAGVKFQVSSSKCLLDITFNLKNGVLEMPCLKLYDETEALIRN